jgi:ABC-type branched-subunit amino acid transport system substrate-binding protein
MRKTVGLFLVILLVCGFLAFSEGTKERKDVVIGVLGPMTGPAAQAGTNMKDSVALGIEELNEKGVV